MVSFVACAGCGDDKADSSDATTGGPGTTGGSSSGGSSSGTTALTTTGEATSDPTTSTSDPSTSGDPTTDPSTTSTTTGQPADPCVVPRRAFIGLGSDGLQLYDLPGRPPTGELAARWSFAAPQLGIEVSDAGALYGLESTADGWVLGHYCYQDGALLDSVKLDIPADRVITSFTWRQQQIVVALADAPPDTGGAAYGVMPDGTTTLIEELLCPFEDINNPEFFPVIDYNPADMYVLALAHELDQFVRTGDIFCADYAGDYVDLGDGVEWYQWVDFDAASYDDFFEVAEDLYGLSPNGRLFVRGIFTAGDTELTSEFTDHLRAFAIGPA